MLNRRQIRIKILQSLYAFFQSDNSNQVAGNKELMLSISKMYEMYVFYLTIFEELVSCAQNKYDEINNRKYSSSEDAIVHKNIIDNSFIKTLANNKSLKTASEKLAVNWVGDVKQDIVKKLYQYLITTDVFNSIASSSDRDFEDDKAACILLFKKEICNFGLIHHFFEENSIYWVDDIDHVCSMVIKTLKSLTVNGENQKIVLPLWKEDEKQFAKDLFMLTLSNKQKYDSLLTGYTKNWEQDRLAKMDIILMNMAINEASEFSSIPLKVTLNEYIEISKFYSTPKSNGFINGILDNVFADLKESGKIIKTGRGLIN